MLTSEEARLISSKARFKTLRDNPNIMATIQYQAELGEIDAEIYLENMVDCECECEEVRKELTKLGYATKLSGRLLRVYW